MIMKIILFWKIDVVFCKVEIIYELYFIRFRGNTPGAQWPFINGTRAVSLSSSGLSLPGEDYFYDSPSSDRRKKYIKVFIQY